MMVCIKTIGGACQDLGKCPRGGIIYIIWSKCIRPPLGGGGGGGGRGGGGGGAGSRD